MFRFFPFIFIFNEACITQALLTGHQGSHANAEPESSQNSGKRNELRLNSKDFFISFADE